MRRYFETRKQQSLSRQADRILSAAEIAKAMGGKTCAGGKYATYPGSEAATHKVVRKRKRHTVTTFPNAARGFWVITHHPDQNWKHERDRLKAQLGVRWTPPKREPAPPPPFKFRNQFYGESLRICRYRGKGRITLEQFNLLINDLRPRHDSDRPTFAEVCRLEFGFDRETVERALAVPHRTYTADERARIFQLTYIERQHLALRRTGSIDLDKAGRERATRDRYNVKRRARRTETRALRATAIAEAEAKERFKASIGASGVDRCYQSLNAVTSSSYKDYGVSLCYNTKAIAVNTYRNNPKPVSKYQPDDEICETAAPENRNRASLAPP